MGQRSGKLRHRVKIQKRVTTQDEYYNDVTTWQDHVPLWSEFTPLSAKDLIASQAAQAEVVARLKIRYREDITSDMRVIYRDRLYDIASPAQNDAESGYEYCTFLLSGGLVKFEG